MKTRSRSGLGGLCVVLAIAGCGGGSSTEIAAASASESGGAEAAARAAPSEPPPPAEEVAPEQSSLAPAPAAAVLANPTSYAEPGQKVVDPVKVSPEVYRVLVESTRQRLLLATWKPGQTDKAHGHPPVVAYALTDLEGIVTGDSGKQKRIKLRAGASFYQNPERSHSFKNVGSAPAQMLLLELSQRVDPMPMPENAAPDALLASPDVFQRVFEDEHVRVLLATWPAGKLDERHSHPELAAYALTPMTGALHADDGQTRPLTRDAGSAFFQDPVKGHTHENNGAAPMQMVLFEPKGGAARASAADPSSFEGLPVESGDGDVTTSVDPLTGVKLDIGSGVTLEIPPGVEFGNVLTLAVTSKRPADALIADGFARHGQTLELDIIEEMLAKQVLLGVAFPRAPEKPGHRFVLAMEVTGDCKGQARKHRLREGGCSHWELLPTTYDAARKKVVARLGKTGGYRLQFGWLRE
jgi:quercetin dioxygenase-like cupin family protein